MSDELLDLSAVEAIARFRDGTLSPVELLTATIARAEAVEPTANAFMATFFGEALQAARVAEQRWMGRGEAPRPLEGVPLAFSDDLEVTGQPLTESCVLLAEHEVTSTEELARRLGASGALVHARTATPELLCSPYMHSRMYGDTPTPWSSDHSAGSGAGAALAAGTTTLAGGLDLIGCTPVAAASCGVVALKPAYGRIPLVYPFALDTYGHYAPMARTVADCGLLLDQLVGPHASDPAALPWAQPIGAIDAEAAGLRIAFSEDLGGYDVHADVRRDTRLTAAVLRDAGAAVEEVELRFDPAEIGDTLLRHTGHMSVPMMARHYARKEQLTPHTVAVFERAQAAACSGPLTAAMEVEMRLYAELAAVFERHDALVCPALAVPAFPLAPDERDFTRALTAAAFVICSRHPFVSVPAGVAANGVPTGALVVGRRFDEATALRVASAVERGRAPIGRPPVTSAAAVDSPAMQPAYARLA